MFMPADRGPLRLSCTVSRLPSSEARAILRLAAPLPGLHPLHLVPPGRPTCLLPPSRDAIPPDSADPRRRGDRMMLGCMSPNVAHLYGPAVRCKLNLQNGSGWSCASVSGPCVEQIAPGHHGYPRAFRLILRSALEGQLVTRSRTQRDRFPFFKSDSQTSAATVPLQREKLPTEWEPPQIGTDARKK